MVFFDRANPRWMWSYFGCSLNNGHDVSAGITAQLGGIYDVCGDEINTPNRHGYGDYNFGIGTIRDYDLSNGGIQHMLRYDASDDLIKMPINTARPEVDWLTNVPWPDHHTDYWGDRQYKGELRYGSTIGIPVSVDLSNLRLSRGGMMLAMVLQDYGAVMRDAGGSNSITFMAEPLCITNHAALVYEMAADAPKLVPHLRVLENQGPTTINGGGKPLVTGPPPLLCPYRNEGATE